MSNFIRYRNGWLNADHIVMIRPCTVSFENESEIYLDIPTPSGNPKVLFCQDTPDQLVEKICGREIGECQDIGMLM